MTSFGVRFNQTNLSGYQEKDVIGEENEIEDAKVLYEHIEGVFAEVRLVVLEENLRGRQYVCRTMRR